MTHPLLLEIPEELFSERLVLRMPRAGGGQGVFEAIQASLSELKPWLEFAQNPPTLEECEIKLRENHAKFILRQNLQFEIFERSQKESALVSSGLFIGRISFPFANWSVPKFEIGYWMDSRQAGKGYMTEAVVVLTQFAFESLEAKRVEIFCDTRNTASRRVAEKAGFVLESVQKNAMPDYSNSGQAADACMYVRFPER